MFQTIIDWLKSFARKDERKEMDPEEAEYWRKKIEEHAERIKEAEKVVGTSPLEQIDYICEHGFAKYNELLYNDKQEEKPKKLPSKTSKGDNWLADGWESETKEVSSANDDFWDQVRRIHKSELKREVTQQEIDDFSIYGVGRLSPRQYVIAARARKVMKEHKSKLSWEVAKAIAEHDLRIEELDNNLNFGSGFDSKSDECKAYVLAKLIGEGHSAEEHFRKNNPHLKEDIWDMVRDIRRLAEERKTIERLEKGNARDRYMALRIKIFMEHEIMNFDDAYALALRERELSTAPDHVVTEARGGMENKLLLSWEYHSPRELRQPAQYLSFHHTAEDKSWDLESDLHEEFGGKRKPHYAKRAVASDFNVDIRKMKRSLKTDEEILRWNMERLERLAARVEDTARRIEMIKSKL